MWMVSEKLQMHRYLRLVLSNCCLLDAGIQQPSVQTSAAFLCSHICFESTSKVKVTWTIAVSIAVFGLPYHSYTLTIFCSPTHNPTHNTPALDVLTSVHLISSACFVAYRWQTAKQYGTCTKMAARYKFTNPSAFKRI